MNFLTPAAAVLRDYYQEPQTNLRMLLARFLRDYAGDDKNALTRTVYGVVRKDIALEHVIGLFLKNKSQKPSLPTHVLLKIAVFLLLFSDSYPEYAVVNEAVNAAAAKEKPFVNAVLRQLLRRKGEIRERLGATDDPGLRYALSPLLLAGLRRLGAAEEPDLEYLDREPVFHLRFNPGCMTMDQARQALEAAGIPCRELPRLDCFETSAAGQVLEKPEQLGNFYVQNTGSQAVALIAAARADKEVCDVAAAPGGKSLTLACLRPELKIWASDVSPQRLRLLEQNIRRLRLGGIFPFTADMLQIPPGARGGRPGHSRRPLHLQRYPAQEPRPEEQDRCRARAGERQPAEADAVQPGRALPPRPHPLRRLLLPRRGKRGGGGKSRCCPRPQARARRAAAAGLRVQDEADEIRLLFAAFRPEQ